MLRANRVPREYGKLARNIGFTARDLPAEPPAGLRAAKFHAYFRSVLDGRLG